MLPGVIGGIAIAFAFVGSLDAAGIANEIASRTAAGTVRDVGAIHMALTVLCGATIGGVVAGWLARFAE
jgi:hypothetical protein